MTHLSRLAVVHLSDLHVADASNPVLSRADEIAAAVPLLEPAYVLVLFTGDMAFSGKQREYELATPFLNRLRTSLQKRKGVIRVDVICLPGNHDCDFDKGTPAVRNALLDGMKANEDVPAGVVLACAEVLQPFEDFRKAVETLTPVSEDVLWRTYMLKCGDAEVLVNSVNSAWSARKSPFPGTLHFPISRYRKACPSNGAFRITATHLPYHWLHQNTYRDFRRLLRQNSEVILTGHEHEGNFGTNVDSETGHTLFIEGAALYPHGNAVESAFICAEIDFATSTICSTVFEWRAAAYQPSLKGSGTMTLKLPGATETIGISREWDETLRDLGASITHHAKEKIELHDFWVYPEVALDSKDEKASQPVMNSRYLIDPPKDGRGDALLLGEQSSGKTALLRTLFLAYYEKGLYPVFLQGKSLSSSSSKDVTKLVHRTIREQYDDPHAEVVIAESPARKVILVDNFDRHGFPAKYLNSVVQSLQQLGGRIIATADPIFNVKEALSGDDFSSIRDFEQAQLLGFGTRLRYELVQRWFALGSSIEANASKIEQANKIISNIVGKGLVPLSPIYILVLLQGLEAGHQGELENSALGHYYQYLILHSLLPSVRQEVVHEVLNYCEQLSWFVSQHNKTRIDEKVFRSFHAQYEDRFDLIVALDDRKKLLVGAKILGETEGELGFRYHYCYYYFLGAFMAKNLKDPEVERRVRQYASNLHVREYGNTILFLAHHSNDDFVMELMEQALANSFTSYPPFSFERDTALVESMVKDVKHEALIYSPENATDKKFEVIEEDSQVSHALDKISGDQLTGQSDERTSEELAVLKVVSEINGLFKGIEILGMMLKARFGSLTASQKQRLLNAMLNGGFRGIRGLFQTFALSPEHFLIELQETLTNRSPNSDEIEELTKKRVFAFMSWLAYTFVRRMGVSVSSRNLMPALARLETEEGTIGAKLFRIASILDLPGKMPMDDIHKVVTDLKDTPFAYGVLSRLAMTRVHLHVSTDMEKQKLFSEFNVQVATTRSIDFKTKGSKQVKRSN